jgi:predicted DNA-binding protein
MTLTLELPSEIQTHLQRIAAERGQTVAECAGDLIAAQIEAAEDRALDAKDAREAREILQQSRPDDWISLDDFKAELKAQPASRPTT